MTRRNDFTPIFWAKKSVDTVMERTFASEGGRKRQQRGHKQKVMNNPFMVLCFFIF